MITGPNRARTAPLGLAFFLPIAGFLIIAPAGLFLLPLAALSVFAATRRRETVFLALLTGGFAAWWLTSVGSPPAQVVRAGAVVATIAFVIFTVFTDTSVTHRCLAAVGMAAFAVVGLMFATGREFTELRWWIEYRAGDLRTVVLSGAFMATRMTGANENMTAGLERWIDRLPDLAATFFPGLIAVQILGGLALAAYIAHRIGLQVRVPPAPFTEFRFTDHVGWLAVLAVGAVLWAPQGVIWLVAANALLVFAVLYGWRGAAVLRSRWKQAGLKSWLLGSVIVVSGLLLWRVTLAGLIVVGAADTGLDLRHRWVKQA